MEKKEMMDAIAEAMDMGMKKYRPGMDAAAFDAEGMKKSFMDSISPVLDAMKEMKDAQDKALTAADEAKATADAKAAGDVAGERHPRRGTGTLRGPDRRHAADCRGQAGRAFGV